MYSFLTIILFLVFLYFAAIKLTGSEIVTMFSILIGFLALGIGMNQKNKNQKSN